MKALLAISLLLAALPASAANKEVKKDICGYRTLYDGTVFTLTIDRSFDPWVQFKLCERKQAGSSFVLVSEKSRKGAILRRRVSLTVTEYRSLFKLYNDALSYNVKDPTMGLDGSTWCLETTRGFTYSKACFWTPEVKTKKRDLSGLYKLGKSLWKIAGLESTDTGAGRLY